ncbi:hypothetical protein BpHYR1_031779 [Brachionus plicatilis]|uniref:Uncharacterized protein n=1 Tax=Brachionus plicatilis TaxID=10195 RepID=A0A3M7RWQ3_BRAPC|nr:hypothetical protein BpHYR1_031779 [Brachionus plicatilis]
MFEEDSSSRAEDAFEGRDESRNGAPVENETAVEWTTAVLFKFSLSLLFLSFDLKIPPESANLTEISLDWLAWSGNGWLFSCWMMSSHSRLQSSLAKPTPLDAPLRSLIMRVELTFAEKRLFSMLARTDSSMSEGRLAKYKFVGSCSRCLASCTSFCSFFSSLKAVLASSRLLKSTKP